MHPVMTVAVIAILTFTGCGEAGNSKSNGGGQRGNATDADTSVLDRYRQYGTFTDPGQYAYLYDHLPDSLADLCRVIRSQFINQGWELDRYRHQIPRERWNESIKYPTVKSALEGLLSYDSRGLVKDRKVEHRLVLICRDQALLLASVLKHRGIPARVRYGFAPNMPPGFHSFHVICEVWNANDRRWMLVDPSVESMDFGGETFEFSNDVWLKMQHKELDPAAYGLMGRFTGLLPITIVVCTDLASILGTEYPVGQYPPLFDEAAKNDNHLTSHQIGLLNTISELMESLDAGNLSKLREIYRRTPEIQFTRSFDPRTIPDYENSTKGNPSKDKPAMEFVDIPAGTFTMGSPSSEQGRKDDEIPHAVTLRAFKMSKFPVTFEQYDQFCEATGRPKPWGRDRGSYPVSQVTWHDAAAFAGWMGCRLPSEAEFEYAARAKTTTPFSTGNCLTSAQANFNGEEPYADCAKGEERNGPLPVGSFPPNAFGVCDMHGNIWQWCNDWYEAYTLHDTINPTGPEKGTNRVIRGGGWRNAAWECRSAYRGGGGLYPGTRGMGIGFRVVKDEK